MDAPEFLQTLSAGMIAKAGDMTGRAVRLIADGDMHRATATLIAADLLTRFARETGEGASSLEDDDLFAERREAISVSFLSTRPGMRDVAQNALSNGHDVCALVADATRAFETAGAPFMRDLADFEPSRAPAP